jgi:MFS family permease
LSYGWVIVVALGITITVSYGSLYYSMGVFLTPVKDDTGWSSGAISGAFAMSLLIAGLIGIPVGHLIDSHGSRPVMVAGSLLGVSGLLLFSLAHSLVILYLAWGLVIGGAAAASFYPAAFALLATWFEERRGRALGILTFLGGFASIIFIPLSSALIQEYGWRTAARVLALILLFVALPLHAFVLRKPPESRQMPLVIESIAELPGDQTAAKVSKGIARSGIFWLITASFFLTSLTTSTVFVHQFSYLVDSGFEESDIALAAGFIGVASLPGRFLLSSLTEKVDAAIITAAVLCFLAASLLALMLASSLAIVYLYVLLFGLGFGAVTPLRAAMMLDRFSVHSYGRVLGMQGAILAVAAAAGPFFAGALRDATGGYETAFAMMVIFYLIAAVLSAVTWLTPRPMSDTSRAVS